MLENEGYLNKDYRIASAKDNGKIRNSTACVAVPITEACAALVKEESNEYFLSISKAIMPYSTKILGRK